MKKGYSFQKGKSKLNHLLFMDDLKLYRSNQNEIDSLEKLTTAATTELMLKKFINVQNRQERRKQRLIEWKEKALHAQFLREAGSIDDGNRWEWLKRGKHKRETESLLCAAQEQALRVSVIKYLIDRQHSTT